MNEKKVFMNKRLIYNALLVIFASSAVLLTSYAFFNYTRTGPVNQITTGQINFEFTDYEAINIGNVFPISMEDIDTNYESNFNLTAHTTIPDGIRYKIYAVVGDSEPNKTRLLDSVMSLKFDTPENGDGFTTMLNNYKDAKSPVFVNGEALISTGIVKDTEDLTEKSYKISLWIDSDKISVSSTTKRAINAEGNPSLADTSTGNVTADRYIQNDNNLVNTTLYPALGRQEGKIIYTTKEFATSYYSIKIVVEAEEVVEDKELVYFNANGGTVSTETKMVTVGSTYGELPEPTREGYTFKGWNGKNLFDMEKWLNSITSVNHGTFVKTQSSITVIATGIDAYTEPWDIHSENLGKIFVQPNKQYTLSWTCTNIPASIYLFLNGINDSSSIKWANSTSHYLTFNTNNNSEFITYRVGAQNVNDVITYSNFQLEEGSTATEYEPYYITNNTKVVQNKDHTLKAIWEPVS